MCHCSGLVRSNEVQSMCRPQIVSKFNEKPQRNEFAAAQPTAQPPSSINNRANDSSVSEQCTRNDETFSIYSRSSTLMPSVTAARHDT